MYPTRRDYAGSYVKDQVITHYERADRHSYLFGEYERQHFYAVDSAAESDRHTAADTRYNSAEDSRKKKASLVIGDPLE